MSIRPVDFNGMIQRTQDVSTLKQNEDNRPVVEQQTIFSQEMKKVEQNLHQVVHAREKENAGYRYDAKEKGNGRYEKEERKKKAELQECLSDINFYRAEIERWSPLSDRWCEAWNALQKALYLHGELNDIPY